LTPLGAAKRYDDDHLEEVGRHLFWRGLACSWRAVCNRKREKQDSGIAVSKEKVLTSFSGRIQLPAKASQRPPFGTGNQNPTGGSLQEDALKKMLLGVTRIRRGATCLNPILLHLEEPKWPPMPTKTNHTSLQGVPQNTKGESTPIKNGINRLNI
jgi:hypothetical protein